MGETNTSYEVCINLGGRWEIQSRYSASGADDAVEEAKQLSRTSRAAIRVIREVYDGETGLYKQSVIYKSANQPSPEKRNYTAKAASYRRRNVPRDAYGRDDDFDEIDFEKPDKRRRKLFGGDDSTAIFKRPKQVTIAGLIGRIAVLILIALMFAAVLTGLVPVALPDVATRSVSLVGGGRASILFVVFIATFFVSFTVMAWAVLSGVEVIGPARRSRAQARTAKRQAARKPRRRLDKSAEDLLKTLNEGASEPKPEAETAAPQPSPEPEQEQEQEVAAAPAEEPGILDADPQAGTAETGPSLSPHGEREKKKMAAFLDAAMGDLKAGTDIDAFSRFGVNLYAAGAVDSLATTQGLEEEDSRGILQYVVQLLGTPVDMAAKFADNAASYLMQPRYIEIYEIGRRAMTSFLEGDTEGAGTVAQALEMWRNPAKQEEKTGPLAVLFTDIVGSTNMTVTLGDEAAQYVVRTHNRIVRSALTNFSGREIKHTGDGIMASFATVSNAVEAAIEIQRRVAANNEAEGDVPLHLCIGINAGEPVVEDDDLFGVTVQLAARLCGVAGSDQIIVSDVVKGLCSGKTIRFVARGAREMKGFAEPVAIHEVNWRAG